MGTGEEFYSEVSEASLYLIISIHSLLSMQDGAIQHKDTWKVEHFLKLEEIFKINCFNYVISITCMEESAELHMSNVAYVQKPGQCNGYKPSLLLPRCLTWARLLFYNSPGLLTFIIYLMILQIALLYSEE